MDLVERAAEDRRVQHRQRRYPGYKTKTEFHQLPGGRFRPGPMRGNRGLPVKNDGNDVSLDREARLLAENALRSLSPPTCCACSWPQQAKPSTKEKCMSLLSAHYRSSGRLPSERAPKCWWRTSLTPKPRALPTEGRTAAKMGSSRARPCSPFASQLTGNDRLDGVSVTGISIDSREPERRYMPGHRRRPGWLCRKHAANEPSRGHGGPDGRQPQVTSERLGHLRDHDMIQKSIDLLR
jgi:hypothetical protein